MADKKSLRDRRKGVVRRVGCNYSRTLYYKRKIRVCAHAGAVGAKSQPIAERCASGPNGKLAASVRSNVSSR